MILGTGNFEDDKITNPEDLTTDYADDTDRRKLNP